MSRGNQLILAKTASIPKPNEYIQMMLGEYASWTFTEEEAPLFKGKWQTEVFKNSGPIDLEIGTVRDITLLIMDSPIRTAIWWGSS